MYKNKYLKYKAKYLSLKELSGGSDQDINNLFDQVLKGNYNLINNTNVN